MTVLACVGCGFGAHATHFSSLRGLCKINGMCEVRQEDMRFYPIDHSFGIDPAYLALLSFLPRAHMPMCRKALRCIMD